VDFPSPPCFVGDLSTHYSTVYLNRRLELMGRCSGPIVVMAPNLGPNQNYTWAHCFQPVYQDSLFLFLTGINQTGIAMVLDPATRDHHLFLPPYDAHHVFWEGKLFSVHDSDSHAFLSKMGFNQLHNINTLKLFLKSLGPRNWHLNLEFIGQKMVKNDVWSLKGYLSRIYGSECRIKNISDIAWEQRLVHDSHAIESITIAAKKTGEAFCNVLKNSHVSETELSGELIGELLKQTPYGLAFPPIIACNKNAAILHYTNNSALFKQNDMVLCDFGLRWMAMCSDVSRTIPSGKKYTNLQRRLMSIVLDTQLETIARVKPGISFNELNEYAWELLEQLLRQRILSKGGRMRRPYSKKPHGIGHLLGIQVHDGDVNRVYSSSPLTENAIITIEPGLYGQFEMDGETIECGIRIEDNLLLTSSGNINLTGHIPKNCTEIEAWRNQVFE
jgi:Xaa-Pro aminopeptidase